MVYAVAMCKKTCNINRCFSSGLVHMWSIFVTINRFLSASFYHDQLDSTTRSLPGEIGQTGTGAIKTWPFFRVYWIHHGLLGVLLEAQKPWWKNSQSYGVSLCQTMALNKHSNKLQVDGFDSSGGSEIANFGPSIEGVASVATSLTNEKPNLYM